MLVFLLYPVPSGIFDFDILIFFYTLILMYVIHLCRILLYYYLHSYSQCLQAELKEMCIRCVRHEVVFTEDAF